LKLKVGMPSAVLLVALSSCTIVPQPLGNIAVEGIIRDDAGLIFSSQEALGGQLSLSDAMARALKYNLDNRVKLMEEAVAQKNFDLTKTDMLPMLAATAGYLNRDNEDASRSISVLTRRESLEPSTSQDKERVNADLRLSWNALDFGVSYLQAKQDADNFLIAGQSRKKVMLNLLQRVRSSYWRAVAMNSMTVELADISARVEKMLDNLLKVREEELRMPISVLVDIRTLVETSQQLDQIKASISLARKELASLINVPIHTELNLNAHESLPEIVSLSANLEELEEKALTRSADYVNQIYKVRVDQLETRKALARLLPGLEFSYGENYHSNSFLFNDQWGEVGVRLTGNLMQLFYMNKIKAQREASENLALTRRLALNMAVVANVHLSWQQYQNATQRLERAAFLNDIDQEISRLSKTAKSAESASGVEDIQNEFRALRSKMGRTLSYVESQDSFGYFLVSIGVDPIPEDYQMLNVAELSSLIAAGFEDAVESLTSIEAQNSRSLVSVRPFQSDSEAKNVENHVALESLAPVQSVSTPKEETKTEPTLNHTLAKLVQFQWD
jgi:multidrug efflux system outer membrane protein